MARRTNSFSGDLMRSLKSSVAAVSSVQDAPGIGHNGGPALSDADIISEVLTRGLLQSAVADEPSLRPLRRLAVSVMTAAEMLGVGRSTIWLLIKEQQVKDFFIRGRRLVTVESIETLVATLSEEAHSDKHEGEAKVRHPRSRPNGTTSAEPHSESDK